MKINEIKHLFDFETPICITTKDGGKTVGVITAIENDFETESGVDEIELDIGNSYLAIELPDIVSIEKMS